MVPVIPINLSRHIIAGIDKNILVYDSDAPVGMFTERLVALMKTCMLHNYRETLHVIYAPKELIKDLQLERKLVNRFSRSKYKNMVLDVHVVPVDYDMLADMSKLQGSIQGADIHMVVGANFNETEILLGSY